MQYKNNNVQLYQQFHEQHVLSLITILLHVLHILLKNLSYFYIHVQVSMHAVCTNLWQICHFINGFMEPDNTNILFA